MENSIKIQDQNLMSVMTKQDQARCILDIITRAVLIAGIKPSDDELKIMILEVTDLIRTRYKNLTVDEIAETIKCGAMGDYQESYLSVRNINSWLKVCNVEKAVKLAKEEKKKEEEGQMPMTERGNFFMKNIDKLPSLKKLIEQHDTKRK